MGAVRLRRGPHPDRARQDAESLLRHLLGKDKAWLIAHWEDPLRDEQAADYMELLERRYQGEPIQYITGVTEFYGLPFRVTPDVLIPRPETELLVESVINLVEHLQAPRIVDVGTGSGAIAVALANQLPAAQITAIDISPQAIDVARQNAGRNSVSDRITFLKGDLLAPFAAHQSAARQFDIVVSNPPYVPATDRPSLAVEVREHEPALALFAGDDGLDVYRRLIPAAFAALVAGGYIALEIGFGQSPAIAELLTASGFHEIDFLRDLQNIPRVAIAQRRT
jgi:release factor glutamine methyltransferase